MIWDVSVAPAWQRGGLGRALVERLTASLVEDGIATITLYAGEQRRGCVAVQAELVHGLKWVVAGVSSALPLPPPPPPRSCPLPCSQPPTTTTPAEPNVVALYEKLGYVADPDGIRGVAFQRSKLARGLAQGLLARR